MNKPSFDALFTSREKLVRTVLDLCDNSNDSSSDSDSSDNSAVFIVNVYEDDESFEQRYIVDKTYEEINAAIAAGKVVFAKYQWEYFLPLAKCGDDDWWFFFAGLTINGSSVEVNQVYLEWDEDNNEFNVERSQIYLSQGF